MYEPIRNEVMLCVKLCGIICHIIMVDGFFWCQSGAEQRTLLCLLEKAGGATVLILKVIYFDEGSATDLIYIHEGGKTDEHDEKVVKKTTDIGARAQAKAEGKFKLFPFFGVSGEADASLELSREGSSLLRKAITNTILTDYLALAKENYCDAFKVIDSCVLYPFPESMTYFKMMTPYLIMTEGVIDIGSNMRINAAMMDRAFESGRRYYELIAEEDGCKTVLRFNINAFRNSYSISDLPKMKLQYHAIKVGRVCERQLLMKSEFSPEKKSDVTGFDIVMNEQEHRETFLDVYDVLFAGATGEQND